MMGETLRALIVRLALLRFYAAEGASSDDDVTRLAVYMTRRLHRLGRRVGFVILDREVERLAKVAVTEDQVRDELWRTQCRIRLYRGREEAIRMRQELGLE